MNNETPEQEAERLYPYPEKKPGMQNIEERDRADLQQQAHITAARMYMDTIDRLTRENDTMRKALEEIKKIKSIDYACYQKTQGIISETLK